MARDVRKQLAAGQSGLTSGAIVSFDLPRDNVLKEIVLTLEHAASTGVGGALTAPFDRQPWTNIKRIELIADGKDTLKSYDGGTLVDINQFDYDDYPATQNIALGASLIDGTAAFPLWHALVMSFASVGMERPQDTWLDTRKLSSLELRVTFGTGLAEMFTTVTAPTTFDRYFLTPWGHEILDISRESTFSVNQEFMTSTAFPTTTATDRQFRLNVGNAYREILLSTVDSNARAAVDRLGRIILTENGIFNRRTVDAGMLKAWNTLRNQLQVGQGVGGAVAASPTVLTTQGKNAGGRVGLYNLPLAEDGRVESLLDTRGYSDLSLFLSWDGANTTDLIRILSRLIIPNVR